MSLQTKKKIPVALIVAIIIIIGEGSFGGLYFKKYNDLKSSSSKTVEQKNKELVTKVGKVYQLPSGEDPVVLNVNKDPSEFTTDQEKAFAKTFKDLKKDDVILLYQKASVAIEWRPSENKVISTASLAVATGTNVALIATSDVQALLSAALTKKLPNDIQIGGKATPVGQYTTSTVVDLTGKKPDIAKKVAEAIGGTVSTSLPVGEKVPDGAEIVVIGGSASSTPTP
jgi:hypothetical protein